MNTEHDKRRMPRSIRKHVRHEKARLRRELPPGEADRAIEQLMRGVRRGSPAAVATKRSDPGRTGWTEEPPQSGEQDGE